MAFAQFLALLPERNFVIRYSPVVPLCFTTG